MKRFGLFCTMLFALLITSVVVFAQQVSDTTLGGQVKEVVSTASGQDLSWKVMLFAAIAGVIVSIIYQTRKGILNTNNQSPVKFVLSYWIKDNLLPKIVTFLVFITTTLVSLPFKLPEGTVGLIILGIVAFMGGLFIDYISDILKDISPKKKSS